MGSNDTEITMNRDEGFVMPPYPSPAVSGEHSGNGYMHEDAVIKETVLDVEDKPYRKPLEDNSTNAIVISNGGEERKSLLKLDSDSSYSSGSIRQSKESFCDRLAHLCQCCMTQNFDHPHEEDSCGTKCRWLFLCPPHGKLAKFICIMVLAFLSWGVPWSIAKEDALPGGNLFGIIILLLSCMAAGWLVSHIPLPGIPPLPPLLGMLVMGFLLRNVPYIDVAKDIDPQWSSSLRLIALTVILTRAGIGLDGKLVWTFVCFPNMRFDVYLEGESLPNEHSGQKVILRPEFARHLFDLYLKPQALLKLKWILLGFAISTSIIECIVVAAFSTLMISFPWDWGFVIGFVLCAVSPAVVVPSLLYLQDKGYGVEGGIPTFLIAGAALNDVIGITGFNVVLGMIFSEGDIIAKIIHGPLELVLGIGVGVVLGLFLWYFPSETMKGRQGYRTGMLLGLALFCGFASKFIHFAGAGALATLVMAFVAAIRWGPEKKPVAKTFAHLWVVFQPLLFGLIGASVTIDALQPSTVGMGAALILIGLAFRSVVAFLAVYWSKSFNMKEKSFLTIAWLPKATVQAAIGAISLDMAIANNAPPEVIEYGTKVLTIAVLSILMTAPTGAAAIGLTGPKLLKLSPEFEHKDEKEKQ